MLLLFLFGMCAAQEPSLTPENTPNIILSTRIVENRCSVLWRIKNYFLYPDNVHGRIESPTFSFSSSAWDLHVYPGGHMDFGSLFPSTDFITIRLNMLSPTETGKAVEYNLGFKDKNNIDFFRLTKKKYFGDVRTSWGSENEISRQHIWEERSKLLSDDVLTIFCDFKVWDIAEEKVELLHLPTANESEGSATSTDIISTEILLKDVEALLEEQKDYDVTLQVGNENFRTHKLLLGARSRVFATMFEQDSNESPSVVIITNIEPSVMRDLLRYIYTGVVNDVSVEKAMGLYVAADKYALLDLKVRSADFLRKNLSVGNACELAILADAHNDRMIIDSVKLFARENTSLLSSEKWKRLAEQYPRLAYEITIAVT